jgi:short-subunit dehydrogenase
MFETPIRPILVTGASSGIGYHVTRALANSGYFVFATVRKEGDLAALREIKHVIPLWVDVRNPVQIQTALEEVVRTGYGLYGLVNNAGMGDLGMLSTWTDEEMFEIFDVNVFGPHRMTNAFLRLLIESKGRIVNIGSQGGTITSKYYGPYTMTKHALEAYTVALHEELKAYDVWVSIIQPGGILSNIGENSQSRTIERFRRAQPPFDEEARLVIESFDYAPEPDPDEPESASNRKPSSPEIVWRAVQNALFSDRPHLRYLVGTRWEGDRVLNELIAKLLDENDNPQHNYSRDELVALLDQHIHLRNMAPGYAVGAGVSGPDS